MLPDGGIHVDRVWKRFAAQRSASTLTERLRTAAGQLRSAKQWTWALADISLSVEPGEAVGLIGDNGSGKSTLLKIVNGTMTPYAGNVEVAGRVGALIDVRSGIHPELTGRENVYLVGALLGLSRRAVAARFDQIVGFAQLEHAIDRQVKYYSTGMQMRLGFAVAAFLEPEILLVDEVLAVGDAGFQQRCLDSMRELLAAGTTLVLVSHDLAAVQAMCRRVVWLSDGLVAGNGPANEVLSSYRARIEERAELGLTSLGPVTVTDVAVRAADGDVIVTGGALHVTVSLRAERSLACRICLGISDGTAAPIVVVRREVVLTESQERIVDCRLEGLPLPRGRYALWLGLFDSRLHGLVPWQAVQTVDVAGPELDPTPPGVVRQAPVHIDVSWKEH
jgi:ABC-type polysaccharide/polyol phosphate transport system ATPase subunit